MNLTSDENITTYGNGTINVNGSKVTANTTDLKVEHKVVNAQGTKRVLDTRSRRKENANSSAATSVNTTWGRSRKRPRKPFAKENVTVHWHTLNITRRVNESHNETQNVTVKETIRTVKVSPPLHIASIYFVLLTPVVAAWALYFHNGLRGEHHYYAWLLPLTLCSMSVGQDFANQSLTMLLEAPNAITAIQAFCMAVATGIWICAMERPALRTADYSNLTKWLGVAVLFAIYQLVNHLVYSVCSLSERTVFTNLCPLISLVTETVLLPNVMKPATSFRVILPLLLMLIGAVIFTIQTPTFTTRGVRVSFLLVLTTVPYRLAQRQFLAKGREFPLSVFCFIDGAVLFPPAAIISSARRHVDYSSLIEALGELPVLLMLLISVATFTFTHLCSLAMLRAGSATTYLVFQNIASLATVTLGICFFGDHVLGTPLACVGLFANLASGVWYSAEATLAADAGAPSPGDALPPKDVDTKLSSRDVGS